MRQVKIAAVGSNGHQIIGLLDGVETAKLVGVAELNPGLSDWQKAHPKVLEGVPHFDALEDLLRETDCELVSLCSARRDQQAGQILACLAAGRHVLAEKPLCTSLDDLPRIRAAAREARRNVWAMVTMIYLPVFRDFERRVRGGEIGEVGQAIAQKSYKFGGNRPQDRGIDGGIIQSAIHAVSFIRSTTGLEFDELSAIDSAVGNRQPGRLQVELAITARLSNGALCQISSNYLNPQSAPWWGNDQLRIYGTKGMLESVDGLTRTSCYREDRIEPIEIPSSAPNYLDDLLAEIATGRPALLTMEDSFRCTRIVLEAQASADAGGKICRLTFD
jgi:predicted dehydrogenase